MSREKMKVVIWSYTNMDYLQLLRSLKVAENEIANINYEITAICTNNSWIHSATVGFHVKEIVPIISPNELLNFIQNNPNYLVILPVKNVEYKNKKNNLIKMGIENVISSECLESHNHFPHESLNSIASFNKLDSALILCSLPKTGNNSVSETFLKNNIEFIGLSHDCNRFDIYFRKFSTIKVITAVREPIIQNLSGMYQEISASYQNPVIQEIKANFKDRDDFFSDFNNINDLFKSVVIKKNDTGIIFNNFMESFAKNILNLSSYPFNKEKGYSIIKKGNIEIFVYQLEKMNSIVNEITEWIGQTRFDEWIKGNEASSKWIADSYNQAKNEIKITQEYFDKCYNDPWVQHFYSQEDIEKFKERWRPHISK